MFASAATDRPAARGPSRRALLRRVRVAAWRHRIALGLLAAVLAARLLLPLVLPSAAEGPVVVVASRDLAAGQQLTEMDLSRAPLARGTDATGFVTQPEDAAGNRLAVALPAGAPLAPGMLAGGGAIDGAPPGTVVVPVRFADDSVAGLLQPGQRIDVLAGATGGADSFTPARTLASDALVMGVTAQGGDGLLPGESGQLALLAVTRQEAGAISGASSWATLSAAWVD